MITIISHLTSTPHEHPEVVILVSVILIAVTYIIKPKAN